MTKKHESKVIVIIPTLNESESLPFLIREMDLVAAKFNFFTLLIIDDNSQDDTVQIVRNLCIHSPYIKLIQNTNRIGFVDSLRLGFSHAIDNNYDIVIQMDADLSHNPHSIPRFVKHLLHTDVVIGSRYIKNGMIQNWNVYRRIVSRFGNILSRIILWMPIKDLTTGFRASRIEVIKTISREPFLSNGYVFQIECVHRYISQGFAVYESPILFTERRSGNSKFDFMIIVNALKTLVKLSQKRFKKKAL